MHDNGEPNTPSRGRAEHTHTYTIRAPELLCKLSPGLKSQNRERAKLQKVRTNNISERNVLSWLFT